MAKFQKKPPVFDALQFTGGQANAKTIIEGISALGAGNYVVRFIPAASEFGLEAGAVKEFKATERLRITDQTTMEAQTVNVGDWVMVNREKTVEVLTNASFTEQFQPV